MARRFQAAPQGPGWQGSGLVGCTATLFLGLTWRTAERLQNIEQKVSELQVASAHTVRAAQPSSARGGAFVDYFGQRGVEELERARSILVQRESRILVVRSAAHRLSSSLSHYHI